MTWIDVANNGVSGVVALGTMLALVWMIVRA
jgi:hypothetical protein